VIKIDVMVEGGKASAGPPLGPALGPAGVNINKVVAAINERTKGFEGMKVPVKVLVDPGTKEFDVEVGSPPVSSLVLRELGVEKGSSDVRTTQVGNLSIQQLIKVAEMKKGSILSLDLKQALLEVSGTCLSMGVTIDGKPAKEFQRDLKEGRYDELLKDKGW